MIIPFILIIFFGFLVAGMVSGIRAQRQPTCPTYTTQRPRMETLETVSGDSPELDVNRQERRELLDGAIIKYEKLLKCYEKQIELETDLKKRGILLQKQITAIEKYNRTLEKREKLDL